MHKHALVLAALLLNAPYAMAQSAQSDSGPWWLGHLLTAIAALLGAGMIVWQIGRQRRNEIDAQRENFKIELRLNVYQEFAQKLSSATESLGAVGMYAFCIPLHMEMAAHGSAAGQVQAVSDRAKTFLDLNAKAQNEVAETVLLIEKYLIIHPDLDIFRMALGSAAHDLRAHFHSLFDFMLNNFPMDVATANGTKTENIREFTQEECKYVRSKAMAYYEKSTDAQCFLTDIQTELQLLFLGNLFPNRPPKRVPADPSKRVLSLDPLAVRSLRQHFLKNTEWGRSTVATSMDVHNHFHGRI